MSLSVIGGVLQSAVFCPVLIWYMRLNYYSVKIIDLAVYPIYPLKLLLIPMDNNMTGYMIHDTLLLIVFK